MKKLLALLGATGLATNTAISVVACSHQPIKYVGIKDMKSLMDALLILHFEDRQEPIEIFKSSFEKYNYIHFDEKQLPREEYSLLVKGFKFIPKFSDEEQQSTVKDVKFIAEIIEPKRVNNKLEWNYDKKTEIESIILLGETQEFEKMEETYQFETNLGEIDSNNWWRDIFDKFLAANPFIWRDGIFIEKGPGNSKENGFILGDGRYYSGLIELDYILIS